MQQEQVAVEEKALKYIAKTADGSMRDALSLLDQCIAFHFGEELTVVNWLDKDTVLLPRWIVAWTKRSIPILRRGPVRISSTLSRVLFRSERKPSYNQDRNQ